MRPIAAAMTLFLFAPVLQARDYAKQAERAAAEGSSAVTIFVDADWGGREDGAARELTRAHAAFEARRWEVVDVEAYTENGDLQGFFVTYRRTRVDGAARDAHR
jgi:hypothetical protein